MSGLDEAAISSAVEARLSFAAALFDAVRAISADAAGVTRPPWSKVDQAAADLLAEAARSLDLEVDHDPAGNLLCALPGRDRGAPRVLTGSHLDSVPTGGHFDGLAGVIAGLTTLAAFRDAGIRPACDVVTIGTRGEESVWYGIAYVGSRLAVGNLPIETAEGLRRTDTGRPLLEEMAALGLDPEALRAAEAPSISPRNTRAFLELHIEQGPVLIGEGLPLGIPTVIRGNVRFPYARCEGRYDHSGATPHAYRQDTVLAVAALLQALEGFWLERMEGGEPDAVFTVGKLSTDAAHHAMTKVAGRCDFTLNFGGTRGSFLEDCRARTLALADEIGAARNVRFALGECVGSKPMRLDASLRDHLTRTATRLALPTRAFATVGHDAATFASVGIPAAMVLVRNAHGSHNPDEEMDLADFGAGVKVLAATVAALAA